MKRFFEISTVKEKWYLWALLLLSFTLFISHTLYIINTHQYPEVDEHTYLENAVKFYDIFRNPTGNLLSDINKVNPSRQPLYGLVLAIPLLLIGTSFTYKFVLWLNLLWYLVTVVSIYFLGRSFLSKKASFLASYIFAFYGFPLFYLHFTYSETFVTSLIVLSLLFLVKTNNFNNRKNVILFSIFFTLANMSRWTVSFFMVGPVMLYLVVGAIRNIRSNKKDIGNYLINATIFFVSIALILFLYYIPNFSYFSTYISGQTKNASSWITQYFGPEQQGLKNIYSPYSMMYYFNILSQQTIFFIVLFEAGFLLSVIHIRKFAFFLLAFIIPYTILTFGTVLKFDRYIVPIYPSMALLSAVTFDYIRHKKLQATIITLTLFLGVLNFLGGSWGVGPMKFSVTGNKYTVPNSILLPMPIGHPRRIWLAPISWPPRKEEFNANLALDTIERDFNNNSRAPFVFITFEYHPYHNAIYSILAYEKRGKFISLDIKNTSYDVLFEYLNKADYMLVKDDKAVEESYKDKNNKVGYKIGFIMREFNSAYSISNGKLPIEFKVIKKIPLPLDNTNVFVYKKNGLTTKEEWQNFADLLIEVNPSARNEIEEAVQNFLSTKKD